MTDESKENLWEKIKQGDYEDFTEKDRELLSQILWSGTMQKALASIYKELGSASTQFLGLDLSSSQGQHQGSQLQGRVVGSVLTLEQLLAMAVEEE